MSESDNIAKLRTQALHIFLTMLWLQLPLIALACWFSQQSMLFPIGAGLVFASLVQVTAWLDAKGDRARIIAAVAIMASISILIGVFDGQKMQVDLHMYYFAALAVLVAACDWRVITVGAMTVALHHSVLNFLLPALVYPGGTDLNRLALHAIVLIIEAGVLIKTTITMKRMFEIVLAEKKRVETAQQTSDANNLRLIQAVDDAHRAKELNEETRLRTAREDTATLNTLGGVLTQLAQGDLTAYITSELPQKTQALKRDFNNAVRGLAEATFSVTATASNIRSASSELSTAIADLSRRTEQQASSIEKTTEALDQLAVKINKTSKGAVQAQGSVSRAVQRSILSLKCNDNR